MADPPWPDLAGGRTAPTWDRARLQAPHVRAPFSWRRAWSPLARLCRSEIPSLRELSLVVINQDLNVTNIVQARQDRPSHRAS